jgi:hypothetical protein
LIANASQMIVHIPLRDCACNYWASNHPDIVLPAIPAGQGTQPSGLPTDPQLNTSIEWLRNPDFPEVLLHAPGWSNR